ncbi:helix-turn-helix transcriptional regulator [Rossellomorea sp. YZS02]|uniref:helix-turn-helix transcriptional regulator n=1 Tax=Rossellomorea sp. YZS02 TaxID=3097358 RepID=UPI002A16A616|nr:helix-turn-helix transcriptional regulator [Rossellomorea sp. YZS02]MDX8344504.1 helix-turn-helix transcriptional regulator [Rossellomorea sp. YZS02]
MVKEENKPFAKTLGQLLKRGRYERGMTQAEFAWTIHMSEEGYGMIERGKRIPSALTLNSIHNNTGISIDRIFQEIGKIEKEKKLKED